jgi:hypothetical protein
MKFLTTFLLILAIAFIPPQSKAQNTPKPKWVALARCVLAVVVITVGGITIHYVKKWCNSSGMSNHNWLITNETDNALSMPLLISGGTGEGTTVIQSCEGMGTAWVNGQSVNLIQTNGFLIGVLSDEFGKPIATNSVLVHEDGETVILDFRQLVSKDTNAPATTRIFRLMDY